ncbi:MAG: sensor domain-containing diguanylate cyclase [Elusimicrobia bacterium]|nr:sensor domain-containing diguanylate cyclase [Elusimicrobiota bacterium]
MSFETIESPSLYEALYRFRKELRLSSLEAQDLLTTALRFFQRELGVHEGSVFLLDERGDFLKETLVIKAGGEIEPGEREEPLWEGAPMRELLFGERDVEILGGSDDEPTQTLLIKLHAESSLNATLPLKETERMASENRGILEAVVTPVTERALLVACAQELGEWLGLALLGERMRRQGSQIESFSELSWLFVTSLRLEDRLRLIVEGIHRLFGFDRLRLYLVEASGATLKGELEVGINHGVRSIVQERYPIVIGESRSLIEILWQSLRQDPWSRILEHPLANHDKVLYLPLKVQTKEIGVLVVDNLISQEPISRPIRHLLGERLSLYDALSHLPNRRYFEQRFQDEFYRAYRHKRSFAVCMMDLDFFKEINDTFGHQMGDRAIAGVGAAVNAVIRQSDFAARWGGDEIAVLLGDANEQDALIVAERVLAAIRDIRLVYPADPPKEIRLTASMGVALYPRDGANLETLMASADQALYQMKFKGRNGFLMASSGSGAATAEETDPEATPS